MSISLRKNLKGCVRPIFNTQLLKSLFFWSNNNARYFVFHFFLMNVFSLKERLFLVSVEFNYDVYL